MTLLSLAQSIVANGLLGKETAQCSPPDSGATTTVYKDAATAAPPASQLLQLRSFTCCSSMASSAIMSASPKQTLTHLTLTVRDTVPLHEEIGSLSELNSLHLISEAAGCLSDTYLSSISKLTKLTSLFLPPMQASRHMMLLPRQLLKLAVTVDASSPEAVMLDIRHLTQLQQLAAEICRESGRAISVALPQQLQQLYIKCSSPFLPGIGLTKLQQLQNLTIECAGDQFQEMSTLSRLQPLRELYIVLHGVTNALDVACWMHVWRQLPQLVGLEMVVACSAQALASVARAISLLSSLTRLSLKSLFREDQEVEADVDGDGEVMRTSSDVIKSLGQLTNLRRLDLGIGILFRLSFHDLMHLSCLSQLTSLSVSLAHISHNHLCQDHMLLSSAATMVFLLELTQLKRLTLTDQPPDCYSYLPVIGRLHSLTYLRLAGIQRWISADTVDCCQMFLSRLTGLKELYWT